MQGTTRTIKSFVCRTGRVTPRQLNALENCLPKYELPLTPEHWDFQSIFGRKAETIVEIGFGMGASLFSMAMAAPETSFIGIEVHRAGLGSLAASLDESGCTNVRLVSLDAVEVFKQYIPDGSLSGIQIFFPDPWHKKKHHKRRLIQPDFVNLLIQKLKPQGFIHCATDWEDYARHMLEVFSANQRLSNANPEGGYVPRPESRPITKFEQRAHRLGHGIWDLIYYKS